MKYFAKTDKLRFFKEPKCFNKNTPLETLKYAIGANMYMPGTQTKVFEKLIDNKYHDIGAITLCCEDAIKEADVDAAEANICSILDNLYAKYNEDASILDRLPLIFVRVRNCTQFINLANKLDKKRLTILAGFNFPKFNSENGDNYFRTLKKLSEQYDEKLYGMPILEDTRVIYKETREAELKNIKEILSKYQEYVLNIRVGGTDFSSLFGIRRSLDNTIYDIRVVADCLIDILNYFLRSGNEYVISGPVWEFFSWDENSKEIKGLERELKLDIQNGFQGKTIIHPSQINTVNRNYAVTHSEYMDAINILAAQGGVFKSYDGNRMNECAPHRIWAERIIARAEIFGVLEDTATVNH